MTKHGFSSLHPYPAFFYFSAVLLLTMFSQNPVFALISLAGGFLFCAETDGAKIFFENFVFCFGLIFLVAICNPLFSHNGKTPLFFLNGNAFTLEALLFGFTQGLSLAAALLWCRGFARVITSDSLLFLLGKRTPKTALVLSNALRFLPRMKKKLDELTEVQKSEGQFSEKRPFASLRTSVGVFSALIAQSLEETGEIAASMEARAFGQGKRTSFSLFSFTRSDFGFLLLFIVCTLILTIGMLLKTLSFSFYPTVQAPPALPLLPYLVFALFALVPALLERREKILWRISQSKI